MSRRNMMATAMAGMVLGAAMSANAAVIQTLNNPITEGAILIDGSAADWAGVTSFPADTGVGTADWVSVSFAHSTTALYGYFVFSTHWQNAHRLGIDFDGVATGGVLSHTGVVANFAIQYQTGNGVGIHVWRNAGSWVDAGFLTPTNGTAALVGTTAFEFRIPWTQAVLGAIGVSTPTSFNWSADVYSGTNDLYPNSTADWFRYSVTPLVVVPTPPAAAMGLVSVLGLLARRARRN